MKTSFAVPVWVTLLVVGCSTSDDGGSADSSRAETSGTTAVTTLSSESSIESALGGDLVGSWTADISDILAANTVNVGGAAPIPCSGPLVMTFRDDGSYDRLGTMTCAMGEMSVTGELSSVGRWATSGASLIISGTVNSTTLMMGGVEVPVPDSFGDGTGDYSIVGDTLTITFNIDPVGPVAQVYLRA